MLYFYAYLKLPWRSYVKNKYFFSQSYGKYTVSTTVNARTSHVISGEGKRTLNLLKGLLSGCWLVTRVGFY